MTHALKREERSEKKEEVEVEVQEEEEEEEQRAGKKNMAAWTGS